MKLIKTLRKVWKEMNADKVQAKEEINHFKELSEKWWNNYETLNKLHTAILELAPILPPDPPYLNWYIATFEIDEYLNNTKKINTSPYNYNCLINIFFRACSQIDQALLEMKREYKHKRYKEVYHLSKDWEQIIDNELNKYKINL